MVLDEVMRLRPPAWAMTRMARRDDRLRGHLVEAGTTVMFGIYFAHRHPDFWDEPEVFRPERFTPERIKARHSHAYLPFAAGPRACIGRRFSIYEMLVTLPAILRRFTVDVLPGQQVGMKVGATIHPDRPILARLGRVAGA
jgi:cytochrome P450